MFITDPPSNLTRVSDKSITLPPLISKDKAPSTCPPLLKNPGASVSTAWLNDLSILIPKSSLGENTGAPFAAFPPRTHISIKGSKAIVSPTKGNIDLKKGLKASIYLLYTSPSICSGSNLVLLPSAKKDCTGAII